MKKFFEKTKENSALFHITIFSFSLFGAIKYVLNEKYIYYWDNKEYFVAFANYFNLLCTDIIEFFSSFAHSIYFSSYNVSSIIFLSLFGFIGTERIDFIFLLYLIYYIPLVFFLAKHLNFYGDRFCIILFVIICSLYTPFIIPTLKGYPDIAGLLPIFFAILLSEKHFNQNKIVTKQMLLLGGIIFLCFLIRRWYLYTIFSFYISFFVTSLMFAERKNQLKTILCNTCIAGFCTVLCILIFQGGLVAEILKSNYYRSYSAFDYGFVNNILALTDSLPFLFFMLTAISLLYIICKKDQLGIFFVIFLVLNVVLHASMQRFDVQHRLPIFFLILLIFIRSLHITNNKIVIYSALSFIVIISTINYNATLFKNFSVNFITQSEKFYPLRHENYNELLRLFDVINNLPDIDKHKISIFVSSDLLCDDMAETVLGDKIVYTSHADTRDGIPVTPLLTKYAIATNKTQTHLGENNQYVIKIPNEQIFNSIGIGESYKIISGPFKIGNTCEAYIYEKIKIFDIDSIKKYLNAFPKDSSNWPNKVTQDDIKNLTNILY